ncbi:ABC transporter ATP-binding protein [Flavilitoribacter nigricans]|uniref:ABC transporter ATP-binding protein n=1 Tax=Flavilitoribacter nigricans (strain ATCC 23147 / DSM 23189 / NBRC 102662 / NCIMB 1420 / SS-2) TaxID=1122177 RepID=A0A2D0NDC4_FLAN2|nr:ABC transporter ATP-binding protein [Flavilitoribacter nigricans]PHN06179.1 ABC transporter ATP-binding protein [Flavilitoribacter nigricans DSM 23189 = NBRC 102662]
MSNPKDKVLSVDGLRTYFNTDNGFVKAVDGISFDLIRGETLGIVGESGSGKSITALSLMRLVPAPGEIVEGRILFFPADPDQSVDLVALPEARMRTFRGKRLSMIFQEPMSSLNPLLRCGEQIAENLGMHTAGSGKDLREEVIGWLRKVQLSDPERIYRSYPHQLSGGQKQRVMIAMAMCTHPDILIADEPTTALDVTVQKAILELIASLQQEMGTAVIFITHDLGVIGQIADRSLVMHRGQIVEQGSVQQLFENPQHPYTKGLLACRPPLDYRLTRLPVVADFWAGEDAEPPVPPQLEKIDRTATRQRLEELEAQSPLLEVRNLKTWFTGTTSFWGQPRSYVKAVDDVSFVVYPGETLGLVGESGCGKTTLGRSILRLEEPSAGRVDFNGQSVTDADERELKALRKEIQIIFQDPYASLNPRMMVGAAIIEPMLVYGIGENEKDRKDRTRQLLEQVGLLPEHFHRYPHEFSGGQRQRVCIARALAVNPRFIVCDEAVSALDVSVQAQVLNLLQSLREQHGLTYIFISHDLSVVKFMSDRILVMKDGKIVESGPADEIYFHPQADYTRELIAAIPK